jgi:hypothetical protein
MTRVVKSLTSLMDIVARYLRGAQGKTASWPVQASIGHLR